MSARPGQTYYDILKVDIHATDEEIKKSYRELVGIWHPDRNQGNSPAALNKTQTINEAYKLLSNAQARSRYDQMLKRQRQKLIAGNENADEKGGASSTSLLKQLWTWLKSENNNG